MTNPRAQEVENFQVRVRCPECRTHFHTRLHRVAAGEPVICPFCHNEMRYQGIGHIGEHESMEAYIHHVEERTCRPHFASD